MATPNMLVTDAQGLQTQPNELTLPAGSLAVAKNMEITRDGIAEVARGFADFSANLPDFTPEQLLVVGGVAYLNLDSGLWYHDGTNWLRKAGNLGGRLGQPRFLYVLSGVLYIAGAGDAVIYALDLGTGSVSILAGRYKVSASTDGTGPAARFANPVGIWSDGTDLYVCDYPNSVRKVTTAGVVTTLAAATGAYAIWGDGAGSLYVSSDEHVIYQVTYPAGVVTTIAGTAGATGTTDATGAAARFNNPLGIWGDGAGSLYVSDQTNSSVRKVTYPGGVVTTFAGTSGATGTTDGTGTAARFSGVTSVVGDGAGNLYVGDQQSSGLGRIRKVTYPGAVVTSPYGSVDGLADGVGTAASFSGIAGMAFEPGGAFYVGDVINFVIRKVYVQTGYVYTFTGQAQSAKPAVLADGVVVGPT